MTYAGPTLEDMQDDGLDAVCMAALGDSIEYQPVGGAFAPLRAYVEYPEAIRSIETGQIVEQDIVVEVLRSDVPVRPSGICRVRLGRYQGATFKPVNVRLDRSGAHWQFEVVQINV